MQIPSITATDFSRFLYLVIKPFVEVSFVLRKAKHSTVPQVKYFKILIQEMILRIDRFFINSLFTFYYGGEHEYNVYTVISFSACMFYHLIEICSFSQTFFSQICFERIWNLLNKI